MPRQLVADGEAVVHTGIVYWKKKTKTSALRSKISPKLILTLHAWCDTSIARSTGREGFKNGLQSTASTYDSFVRNEFVAYVIPGML